METNATELVDCRNSCTLGAGRESCIKRPQFDDTCGTGRKSFDADRCRIARAETDPHRPFVGAVAGADGFPMPLIPDHGPERFGQKPQERGRFSRTAEKAGFSSQSDWHLCVCEIEHTRRSSCTGNWMTTLVNSLQIEIVFTCRS